MKKLLFISLLSVYLVSLSSTVFAQERKSQFLFGGGINYPNGPSFFTDLWIMGFNINGGAYYKFNEIFKLGLQGDYYRFGFDKDAFIAGSGGEVTVSGGDISVYTVMVNARFTAPFEGNIDPYFELGSGLFRISPSDITVGGGGASVVIESENESKLGVSIGGGVEISVNENVSILLGLTYVIGSTEEDFTQFIPIKLRLVF